MPIIKTERFETKKPALRFLKVVRCDSNGRFSIKLPRKIVERLGLQYVYGDSLKGVEQEFDAKLTEYKPKATVRRPRTVRMDEGDIATIEAIKKARIDNPCASLREIGNRYGRSRERVRQILSQANLPTKHYIRPKQQYECLNCGQPTPHKEFCNKKCRHEYKYIKVACDYCGKLKEYNAKTIIFRREKQGRQNRFFCSRYCMGKWLGTNYGRARKYDYDEIERLLRAGHKYKEICSLLNMPLTTGYILIGQIRRKRNIPYVPSVPGRKYDYDEIERLLRAGHRQNEICSLLNMPLISGSAIMWKIRKERNIPYAWSKQSHKLDYEKIWRMHQEGMKGSKIGRTLNIPYSSVYRIITIIKGRGIK